MTGGPEKSWWIHPEDVVIQLQCYLVGVEPELEKPEKATRTRESDYKVGPSGKPEISLT